MRVDHGTRRSIINDGSNEYLQIDSSLYIGGLPKEQARTAANLWHIRNTTSFQGKIIGLQLN